jgi:hypothetical protein
MASTRVAAMSFANAASRNSHAVTPHDTRATTNNAPATTHQLSATRGRARARTRTPRAQDQPAAPTNPSATSSAAIEPVRAATHAPTAGQVTHPAAAATQHNSTTRPAVSRLTA